MGLRFTKMHGAGNDFVVIDLRGGRQAPSADLARAIGDRHTGVGFDQLLSIEDSDRADRLARYRIWNSDGSLAQQCGNGARCVAAWLARDNPSLPARFVLDSPAGPIEAESCASTMSALAPPAIRLVESSKAAKVDPIVVDRIIISIRLRAPRASM